MENSLDITEDSLLNNSVKLLQLRKGHRAGTDAVLLAASVPRVGSVVDVGASSGAVGLMIGSRDKDRSITFIEQEQVLANLCKRNAALNGLTKSTIINADLYSIHALCDQGMELEKADIVVTNPPYFTGAKEKVSPDKLKAAAHVFIDGSLSAWIRCCNRLLRPKGTLCLIHRADQLYEILSYLKVGFGNIRIKFIFSSPAKPAIRIVIQATKGSRAPLIIEPPFFLNSIDGVHTLEAQRLHESNSYELFSS